MEIYWVHYTLHRKNEFFLSGNFKIISESPRILGESVNFKNIKE